MSPLVSALSTSQSVKGLGTIWSGIDPRGVIDVLRTGLQTFLRQECSTELPSSTKVLGEIQGLARKLEKL